MYKTLCFVAVFGIISTAACVAIDDSSLEQEVDNSYWPFPGNPWEPTYITCHTYGEVTVCCGFGKCVVIKVPTALTSNVFSVTRLIEQPWRGEPVPDDVFLTRDWSSHYWPAPFPGPWPTSPDPTQPNLCRNGPHPCCEFGLCYPNPEPGKMEEPEDEFGPIIVCPGNPLCGWGPRPEPGPTDTDH